MSGKTHLAKKARILSGELLKNKADDNSGAAAKRIKRDPKPRLLFVYNRHIKLLYGKSDCTEAIGFSRRYTQLQRIKYKFSAGMARIYDAADSAQALVLALKRYGVFAVYANRINIKALFHFKFPFLPNLIHFTPYYFKKQAFIIKEPESITAMLISLAVKYFPASGRSSQTPFT